MYRDLGVKDLGRVRKDLGLDRLSPNQKVVHALNQKVVHVPDRKDDRVLDQKVDRVPAQKIDRDPDQKAAHILEAVLDLEDRGLLQLVHNLQNQDQDRALVQEVKVCKNTLFL